MGKRGAGSAGRPGATRPTRSQGGGVLTRPVAIAAIGAVVAVVLGLYLGGFVGHGERGSTPASEKKGGTGRKARDSVSPSAAPPNTSPERSPKVLILQRLQKDPRDVDALTELCELYEDDYKRSGKAERHVADLVQCHTAVVDTLESRGETLDEDDASRAVVAADRVLSLQRGDEARLETAAKGLTLALSSDARCDGQPPGLPFAPHSAGSCVRAAAKLRTVLAQLGREPTGWGASLWPDGRSHLQHPELRAKPVWDAAEVPWLAEIFAELRTALLAEWPALRTRNAGANLSMIAGGPGQWFGHSLLINGEWDRDLCAHCPKSCGILAARREMTAAAARQLGDATPPDILASFLRLEPGGQILPHHGRHGTLLASLGIEGLEGSKMIVGGQTVEWSGDRFLVFDDAFEHSVTHTGPEPRVVFTFNFVHPDLLKTP